MNKLDAIGRVFIDDTWLYAVVDVLQVLSGGKHRSDAHYQWRTVLKKKTCLLPLVKMSDVKRTVLVRGAPTIRHYPLECGDANLICEVVSALYPLKREAERRKEFLDLFSEERATERNAYLDALEAAKEKDQPPLPKRPLDESDDSSAKRSRIKEAAPVSKEPEKTTLVLARAKEDEEVKPVPQTIVNNIVHHHYHAPVVNGTLINGDQKVCGSAINGNQTNNGPTLNGNNTGNLPVVQYVKDCDRASIAGEFRLENKPAFHRSAQLLENGEYRQGQVAIFKPCTDEINSTGVEETETYTKFFAALIFVLFGVFPWQLTYYARKLMGKDDKAWAKRHPSWYRDYMIEPSSCFLTLMQKKAAEAWKAKYGENDDPDGAEF